MTRSYKTGDLLRHQTANRAEEAWERGDRHGRVRERVMVKSNADLPRHSVVRLGSDATPFSRDITLELPDNLSEGAGLCYTNADTAMTSGSSYWLEPVAWFPKLLLVDGDIMPSQTATVNDGGKAVQGSGPLYCVSMADNGAAWFVSNPSTQSCKIGKPIADVGVGALGTFRIYRRPEPGSAPVDTGETVDAWHDWMTGGEPIPADTECKIEFFADEGVWRVVNAEYQCEEPA